MVPGVERLGVRELHLSADTPDRMVALVRVALEIAPEATIEMKTWSAAARERSAALKAAGFAVG